MSWSVRVPASGFMIGLLRVPSRNRRNWAAMYTALWPARRGHSGLVLFPLGPWQEEHTADFVAPSATLPCANGSSGPVLAVGVGAVGGEVGVGSAAAGAAAAGFAALSALFCARAGTCTRANAIVAASAVRLGQLIVFAIVFSFRFVPWCEGAELYTTADSGPVFPLVHL